MVMLNGEPVDVTEEEIAVWDAKYKNPSNKEEAEYYRKCKIIHAENEKFLDLFVNELEAKGYSEKTVDRHILNVDTFINLFLTRSGEPKRMHEGLDELDDFFRFYIIKCMWSRPYTVRGTCTSLNKFYKCMRENGKISEDQYVKVTEEIKGKTAIWVEQCNRWDTTGVWNG